MVPRFRYHVVTVVAIFLALGVGVAIGSSFVSAAALRSLTNHLNELKSQYNARVAVAEESNRRYTEFVARAGRLLTASRLAGVRVAVVQTGDYPDTARAVADVLAASGATVASMAVVDAAYPTRAQVTMPKLGPQLVQSHPGWPQDATTPLRVLAAALRRGSQDDTLKAVQDAGLVRTVDGDYTQPVDYVVLVGGASPDQDSRADSVDVPLAALLKQFALQVVEVEPLDVGTSYIGALRGSDITTVDNADTDLGRICTVLALKADRGNYGVKPTARSGILPQDGTL